MCIASHIFRQEFECIKGWRQVSCASYTTYTVVAEFADVPVVRDRTIDHFEVGRRKLDNRAEGTAGQFLLTDPGLIAIGGR